MKNRIFNFLLTFVLILGSVLIFSLEKAAEAAEKISVSNIDYDNLTMQVNANGNSIIYFSTDAKKTWNEIEGATVNEGGKSYKIMDISWASSGMDVTVCFKGDANSEVTEVTIPKQSTSFKVKYQKASGEFTFTGYDGFSQFMWRKTTDYNWYLVDFDESSASYQKFLQEMEALKFKGAKVAFRTGQVKGTDIDNMGERPGKEVVVAIAKRANAPSIKVNVAKLTLNTKDTMEYYSSETGTWMDCEKNMLLSDIAPEAMYSNGKAQQVTLKIRVAETEKKPYSLSSLLVIPAQTSSPVIGTDVTYKYDSGKLILSFLKASADAPVEYCLVKATDDFDESKAKWKTVKAIKDVSFNSKSAGTGSTIYFRFKGIAANANKNIDLKLPSTYCSFSVNWPATPSTTPAAK